MRSATFAITAMRWSLLTGVGIGCAVGCSNGMRGAGAIPASAIVLNSGQNSLITATPNAVGTVYVYDSTADKLATI